jgi:hypothetical protein
MQDSETQFARTGAWRLQRGLAATHLLVYLMLYGCRVMWEMAIRYVFCSGTLERPSDAVLVS